MINRRRSIDAICIMLMILLIITVCSPKKSAGATDNISLYGTDGPWGYERVPDTAQADQGVDRGSSDVRDSLPAALMMKMIGLFSTYVSQVDGDRCPMYPTCSSYGMEVLRTHGVVIGIVMISDRLIHESNEMDNAPLVNLNGRVRYFDPVSNNDFWWDTSETNLDK